MCNLENGTLRSLKIIGGTCSPTPALPPVPTALGTATDKVSEFLDNRLKPVMREGMSYIKDSNDFMHKIKDVKYIPNDALLVTADVEGLYPSIPHETRLQALDVERTKRFRYMI